jgi:hypothetical protein
LLCLVSLFTHMHIFWIIALVLAFIELPDFGTPLQRIAGSAEKMAGLKPGEGLVDLPSPGAAHGHHADEEEPAQPEAGSKPVEGPVPLSGRAEAPPKHRERIHA